VRAMYLSASEVGLSYLGRYRPTKCSTFTFTFTFTARRPSQDREVTKQI